MKCLLSALLIFCVHISIAQPLGNINNYLKNLAIPKVAKLYYAGKFTAHDDDSTSGIIDSINTKNSVTRPFYLLLISKIIRESDGALSEALFPECVGFFEKRPNELIEFLYCKNQKERFKLNWAYAIAQGLDLSDKNDKQHLKESVLRKCKPENRSNIKTFWSKVEHEIH